MACSASMNAQMPPIRWALASTWYSSVVLPDDSGPKISTMRPRGTPPTPRARSSDRAPVGIASTSTAVLSPSFITEPWPNSRSIWVTAALSAASLAFASFAFSFASRRGFRSAISSACLSAAGDRQLHVGHRHVLRTRRPEQGTVEGHSDAEKGLQKRLRERSRGSLDRHLAREAALLAAAPGRAALGAHPRDRQVRPEVALFGLVEAGLDQVCLDLRLNRDCAGALGIDREQTRAPAARDRDGVG